MEILHQENGTCIIDNKYIVTPDGRVFTIHKNGEVHEQKPRHHTNGYLRVLIHSKDYYIHRLVAMCFIDNPNDYIEVNHKDGNKENNSIENLEWCTRSYNNKHCFQTGLRKYNELFEMARKPKLKARCLSKDAVIQIRASKESDTTLAKLFNVTRGTIYQIRAGLTYKEV